jgi:hypothetical protein
VRDTPICRCVGRRPAMSFVKKATAAERRSALADAFVESWVT